MLGSIRLGGYWIGATMGTLVAVLCGLAVLFVAVAVLRYRVRLTAHEPKPYNRLDQVLAEADADIDARGRGAGRLGPPKVQPPSASESTRENRGDGALEN